MNISIYIICLISIRNDDDVNNNRIFEVFFVLNIHLYQSSSKLLVGILNEFIYSFNIIYKAIQND